MANAAILLAVLAFLVAIPMSIVAYAVTSPTFVPQPGLRWARWVVKVLVVVPIGMLIVSLTKTWYVVDRMGAIDVTDASSRHAQTIVAAGIGAGVCTAIGVHGRRNWALPLLIVAYFLLAWCWLEATPAWTLDPSEVSGETAGGLELATDAIVAVTLVAGVGGLVRAVERRALMRAGPH
jgi:hypothetical protein